MSILGTTATVGNRSPGVVFDDPLELPQASLPVSLGRPFFCRGRLHERVWPQRPDEFGRGQDRNGRRHNRGGRCHRGFGRCLDGNGRRHKRERWRDDGRRDGRISDRRAGRNDRPGRQRCPRWDDRPGRQRCPRWDDRSGRKCRPRGSATRGLSTPRRMRRSAPAPLKHLPTMACEGKTSTVGGSSTEATSPTAKTPLSMTRPGAI